MSDIMHILSHIAKVRAGTEEKMRLLDELESSVIIEGIKAGRIGLGPPFKPSVYSETAKVRCAVCRGAVNESRNVWVKRLTIGRLVHEKCGEAAEKGNEDVPY